MSHDARVAAAHRGGGLELITGAGPRAGYITGRLRHAAAGPLDLPAVGDWVTCDPESGAVHAVRERTSALVRATRDGRAPQVLAANVDLVVVVASLTRELSLGRIERMLTLAADAPAEAVVVLSKADLVPDPAARVAEVRAAIGGGTPVLPISTVSGTGLDALAARLGPGVTGVLLGASGVGKTTQLNALAGGGVVIDTPGLKLPRIWEQASGLTSVFADVEALARGCRFADCRHAGEPGCAVAGAVAPERLEALEQLRREEAWAESRRDEGARRRRKEAERRSHREYRRVQRDKRR